MKTPCPDCTHKIPFNAIYMVAAKNLKIICPNCNSIFKISWQAYAFATTFSLLTSVAALLAVLTISKGIVDVNIENHAVKITFLIIMFFALGYISINSFVYYIIKQLKRI